MTPARKPAGLQARTIAELDALQSSPFRRPVALTLLACTVACSRPKAAGGVQDVTVFAAASLTESLSEVGRAWTQRSAVEVTFSFGATSQLARQLEQGAPADVFASADAAWMETVDAAGLVRKGSRHDLLSNRLVVVVPPTSSFVPRSLADLGRAEVARLGLAGESVPAGRYADAALAAVGQGSLVEPKIARGDSVRTVLRWVAQGECDAGFVYASDAKAEPSVSVAFEVPPDLHPAIVYPFAVLASSDTPELAADFIDFCASPRARAIFEDAGFVAATP